MNIVKLNESNYEEVLKSLSKEDDLKDVLRDVFLYLPQKNEIVSRLIVEAKLDVEEILTNLLEDESLAVEEVLSTAIYAKRLGFEIGLEGIVDIESTNSTTKSIPTNTSRILEYWEILKNKFGETNPLLYFYCLSTVKNFRFSVSECVRELMEIAPEDMVLSSLVSLSDSEDPVYLCAIFLRVLKGDEEALFEIMHKPFRSFLLAMMHENNLLKKPLRKFVDEETAEAMLRFVNPEIFYQSFPEFKREDTPIKPLRKGEFVVSGDKVQFFQDFCLLGSPSVSHFLSYLEIYKKHFKLTEEEKKQFVEIFKKIFKNRRSFSRIILGKMELFGIINS